MTGEAVLLRVRAGGDEVAVAALADVPVTVLARALAEQLALADPGRWALAPDPFGPGWPPGSTLRGLAVLDGTVVVLLRPQPDPVSGARS